MTARTLAGEVTDGIIGIHKLVRFECEARWKNWRDDYLDELRRLYTRSNGAAYLRLSPKSLDDPLFLLWSMHNTWTEVFSDLDRVPNARVKPVIDIRNRANHDPLTITRNDVDRVGAFERAMSAELLRDGSKTLEKSWPPTDRPIPPPPRRTTSQKQNPTTTTPNAPEDSSSPPTPADQFDLVVGKHVLPIYVACDVSTSMADSGIRAVREGLLEMRATFDDDPVISDKVLVSVVSFSTTASIAVPICAPGDLPAQIPLEADGVTNYGALFSLLKKQIAADFAGLPDSVRPLRPIVFMLTDGDPTDRNWITELDDFADDANEHSPTILVFPCGFRTRVFENGITTLTKASRPRIWQEGTSLAVAEALQAAVRSVTRSVVMTAHGGGETLEIDF